MTRYIEAFADNFLGQAPRWYKLAIIGFLVANPLLLHLLGPFTTGWILILEFIFTLALALKCYPLQPGGLLALEAIVLHMASAGAVYEEARNNFPVILLLMFMVAGIYFMKDLLLFVFTRLLLRIQSKVLLALLFSSAAAVLSAFLDALTVTAVLISVATGFYSVYHKVASGGKARVDHDNADDSSVYDYHRHDLEAFRSFLRSLMMHGAVGTALGGVCTLVGEPQNLLIGAKANWDFVTFFLFMAPVTLPVLAAGLVTTCVLELTGWFGYGAKIPPAVLQILREYDDTVSQNRSPRDIAALIVQAVTALLLVAALAFHVAEVGIVGLTVIVLLTAFNGIVEEHRLGRAFAEALPFTALLVVFFAIVAVIHEQHLFQPIIQAVFAVQLDLQAPLFFLANGALSAISDNVFVATVYINEVKAAFEAGRISYEHFETLAVAINTGTNLPSVATPNGQAAFLFLLTSALAPLLRLSYGRMVWMALPYTLVMSTTGLLATVYLL